MSDHEGARVYSGYLFYIGEGRRRSCLSPRAKVGKRRHKRRRSSTADSLITNKHTFFIRIKIKLQVSFTTQLNDMINCLYYYY